MAQSWPWCSQIAVNIYIYDLDAAVAHSKVHHSAEDDTNMLYIYQQFFEIYKQKGQLHDLRH